MSLMQIFSPHPEGHLGHRAGWLRAAVLGANDGLVSTSSLMVGVATASNAHGGAVLTAGVAGLAAGAMAMAAGEWVSVSSQTDVEREELIQIYEERGLPRALAEQVGRELSKGDLDTLVAVHARDELGHSASNQARPVQAALASAASFTAGGLVPFLGMIGAVSGNVRIMLIAIVTIVGLAVAGFLGARAAGTSWRKPMLRVVLGGTAAMAVTALVGQLAGVVGA